MRVTDLMVGDWVRCNDLKRQVAVIGETVGFLDCNNQVYWAYEGFDRTDPIPLTDEILAKISDFTVRGEYVISGENRYPYVKIAWSRDKEKFYFSTLGSNCYLDYVHQLQHLLRLCGIKKEIEL